jgi:hypothetical protein
MHSTPKINKKLKMDLYGFIVKYAAKLFQEQVDIVQKTFVSRNESLSRVIQEKLTEKNKIFVIAGKVHLGFESSLKDVPKGVVLLKNALKAQKIAYVILFPDATKAKSVSFSPQPLETPSLNKGVITYTQTVEDLVKTGNRAKDMLIALRK